MKKSESSRRDFLKKASAATAGVGALTVLPASVVFGKPAPSDKINVAIIGTRNMGFGILKHHLSFDDTNCVAMCDIDRELLEDRAGEVKDNFGFEPTLYGDYRKMLEQKDIDAVIVGTPDHWHCLNVVDSVAAGKDVYVEKPMANTIEECNIITAAANHYDRIVQVGQQQRSNPIFIESIKMVKSGLIGSLRKVSLWANFNYGLGCDAAMDEAVPDGIDYDMWLGPAPARPFNRNHFHGTWRHFWNYGGGMFSDWGVHLIDMGLWVKDQVKAPEKVMTFAANNSGFSKKRDTFDTMSAMFPTKDYVINYEMIAGVQDGPFDNMYGVSLIGDRGTIKADRGGYKIIPEFDGEKGEHMIEAKENREGGESHRLHVRNFLDSVKTRKTPACPPEVGRAAALHVHVANISARIDEPYLIWDDRNNRFANSERANHFIVPEYRAPWKLPKIG